MAAEQLNRKCYMMEFSPIYVDVIIKRWEEMTGRKAEFVGNVADEADWNVENESKWRNA